MWRRFVSERIKPKLRVSLDSSDETVDSKCSRVSESVNPLIEEIECLKQFMWDERKELLNRIASLEEKVRNISTCLLFDENSNKHYSQHNGDSTPSATSNGNKFGENSKYRSSVVELRECVNRGSEYSVHDDNKENQSDEVDKTGFKQVKLRALQKAAQCWPAVSGGVTLGPKSVHSFSVNEGTDAFQENWSPIGKTGEQVNDVETPKAPKSFQRQEGLMKCVRSIKDKYEEDETIVVDEEKLCQRRILAELNQLGLMEAQAAKFRHLKEWEEHDKRGMEESARRAAQHQQEELKRQQAKMREIAKVREEEMRKHEELAAQQTIRYNEHCRKQEETRKQQLEAQRQSNELMAKKKALSNRVYEYHQSFSIQYREILELLKAHEELKKAIADDLGVMESCYQKFGALTAKFKLDQITEEVVANAQNLLDIATTLNAKAKNELAKIEELKKKEEKEAAMKKKEEQKNRVKEKKLEQEKQLAAIGHEGHFMGNSQRFQDYLVLHKNFENVEHTLENFVKDDSLKKFRSDCQKAVNIPVNAISAQNSSHLYDKYKKLISFLQKQTVVISEKRITAATHQLGPLYSLNYLAAKTVKQGELAVSSNPEAAYPIAAVVVALWSEMPEYGKLLLAQFYKASPYLIPSYWERKDNEKDEDFYKRLGFLYVNGEKEEMDKFLKRQSGIMRLYCAIIVTPQNKANRSKPHPLPISEAWNWLTSFISLPPKVDISATLLLEMLEITGDQMMSTYKAQFRKLLHLICISYLPVVEKITPTGRGGPVTRLRGFLEGLISGKNIPPPKGLLSPNFW